MGTGNKFKLSSVLPNVFGKIRRIRKGNRKPTRTSSSTTGEYSASTDADPNDFSIVSRDSYGDRSPSPVRTFPQNKDRRDFRYSLSPTSTHKSYEIRFPPESPLRSSRGTWTRPHSPQLLHSNSPLSDPGHCTYDSPMALVPHDGGRLRSRSTTPQKPLGRSLVLSKLVNDSTHSDSEISDLNTARIQGRIRHSRARSVHVDSFSWVRGGNVYEGTTADESTSQWSDTSSARPKRGERRGKKSMKVLLEQEKQVYAGPSPNLTICSGKSGTTPSTEYCTADDNRQSEPGREDSGRRSIPDSGGEDVETDLDDNFRCASMSRRLSFTTDDNFRPFDDTFSSDDDFYRVRGTYHSNTTMDPLTGQSRSWKPGTYHKSQRVHNHNAGLDGGYASGEMALTEDESRRAAILRREAVLAKTVRNANDGWAQAQSRFSTKESKPTREGSFFSDRDHDSEKGDSKTVLMLKDGSETSSVVAAFRRDASLVKTVLSSKDWAREDLASLAKANELDREQLTRLRGGSLDHNAARRDEEGDKITEYKTFGLPPSSKEVFSRRGSRNASPTFEVEKHTKGRIDYKSSSPGTNRVDKRSLTHECDSAVLSRVVYEEFMQPLSDSPPRIEKSTELTFGRLEGTQFHPTRSDSVLFFGGGGRLGSKIVPEEKLKDLEWKSETPTLPAAKTLPLESQDSFKPIHHHDDINGKISPRSLSPGSDDVVSTDGKNSKLSSQLSSPALSHEMSPRPKSKSRSRSPRKESTRSRKSSSRSSSPIPELSSKTLWTPSPSPPSSDSLPKHSDLGPSEAAPRKLNARAEAGMRKLDSVAVVKASYDPYHDFRESMVEMILENDIQTAQDLEDLLQCYLSLNSSEFHKIIVQVFTDIWGDIFEE